MICAEKKHDDKHELVAQNLNFIKYCIWIALGRKDKTPIPEYLGVATEAFLRCIKTHDKRLGNIRTYSYKAITRSVRLAMTVERCIVTPPALIPQSKECLEKSTQAFRPHESIYQSVRKGKRRTKLVNELHAAEEELHEPDYIEKLNTEIDKALNKLPFREREIIKLRYGITNGHAYTLEETGHIFKISKERVRQIEMRGLRKLQQYTYFQPLLCLIDQVDTGGQQVG